MEGTSSVKGKKLSLSRKSPMPKKGLRKAMSSPYETIRTMCKDVKEVEELMERLLASVKRSNSSLPWSKLREMNKEERRLVKEEKVQNIRKGVRDQMVCGMNEVCSAIEKHTISFVLICEYIVPAFMMDFILDLATVHSVPILILPNLRKLTLETLGFSCSCLGFKLNTSGSESSHPLHKLLETLKKCEPTKKEILCRCPAKDSVKSSSEGPHDIPSHMLSWRSENEESRKLEREQQEAQPGSDSAMDSCPMTLNAMLETSPNAVSKRVIAEGASVKKKPNAHPYLRPFLRHLHSSELKKQKSAFASSGTLEEGDANVIQDGMERKQNASNYYLSLQLTDNQ